MQMQVCLVLQGNHDGEMVMVMVMVMMEMMVMMRIVRKNLRQIAEVSVKVRNGETSKRDVGGQTALPLNSSFHWKSFFVFLNVSS